MYRAQFVAHFRVHHQQPEHAAAALEAIAAHQLAQLHVGVVHQQVEVVGLGDLAEGVAGGGADQRIQACPALILVVGVGNLLRQGLIGVLPALVLGLLGAQFGAVLLAGGSEVLQVDQRTGQLLGIEIAVLLCLMIEQVFVALLYQDVGLFDGFLAVLQALAQFADLGVVDAQQVFEAAVIQLGMTGTPVADLAGELKFFAFQCMQAFPLGFELGGDLH
ncbi:hypothetical protein D3C78_1072680 [compost metagenome]